MDCKHVPWRIPVGIKQNLVSLFWALQGKYEWSKNLTCVLCWAQLVAEVAPILASFFFQDGVGAVIAGTLRYLNYSLS